MDTGMKSKIQRSIEEMGDVKFTVSELMEHVPGFTIRQIGNALQALSRDKKIYRTNERRDDYPKQIVWSTIIPRGGIKPSSRKPTREKLAGPQKGNGALIQEITRLQHLGKKTEVAFQLINKGMKNVGSAMKQFKSAMDTLEN